MKLVGTICRLDRFLDNWQIVQRNLQIGQIGTEQIPVHDIVVSARKALEHDYLLWYMV